MSIKTKKAIANISYAFSAQGVSLILSVIMSLIVPKVLGLEHYSYWQLFVFYASYVNIFHFGVNDGVYLRLGGKEYDDINHRLIGGEIKLLFFLQIILSSIIFFICCFWGDGKERYFVIACVAIYMLAFNSQCFLGYIFQAVNQMKIYSRALLIDKLCYIAFLLIFLINGVTDFRWYILGYLLTCFLSVGYLVIKGKKMLFTRLPEIANVIRQMILDSKNGLNLTIASIASSLVIGTSRFLVDFKWGITFFGKLSFALSMTNFFLLFIRQIGLVLFPIISKEDIESRKKIYLFLREGLKCFLPAMYVVYIPAMAILQLWLPEYRESLIYLAFLLPICLFDSEMQIVGSTYLKALRKEKNLLFINVFVFLLNFVLSLITVLLFDNIYAIIVEMVLVVAVRSVIATIIVEKHLDINKMPIPVAEIIFSIFFMLVSYYLSSFQALITFFAVYLIYLFFKRKKVMKMVKVLKREIINNHS